MREHKVYWSAAKRAFVVKFKDEHGVWQSKAVPVSLQRESEARLWAEAWVREGAEPVELKPTFGDVAAIWLERKLTEFADDPKSLSGSKRFAKHWIEPLRSMPMQDCGIGDASSWVEWVKSKTKSPYTARNVVAGMRGFVVEARGMGWVKLTENVFADPWIKRVLGPVKPAHAEIVRLERHQLKQLLACKEIPTARRLRYVFASTTALRAGEVAALRACDVKDGIVHVYRQLTNGRFKPPKKGSRRLVPLHPLLTLEGHFWVEGVSSHHGREGSSRLNVEAPLLAGRDGKHDTGNWSRELREDLALAGLSPRHSSGADFTFHALRRTALTVMRASGMPIEDVKAVAGHCGASITERNYAEADLQRLRAGITAAFEDLIPRA